MSVHSSSAISIVKVTCAACGHQRDFDGENLTAGQLDRLGNLICDNCGHDGAVLMMAHTSETGSALEPPPASALVR
jgi:hypothetical protein